MKIGITADSYKMANIVLMKIANYHKNIGDEVEWYSDINRYDKVYYSKIFNTTPLKSILCDNIEIGGTGFDIGKKLPLEIENCELDYSLYPNIDYSIQLFHRGCIRKCAFCVVPQKEGKIEPIEKLNNFNPKGRYVEVLDNNFFANPKWERSVEILIKNKQPVNLHGVDVRIITKEHCEALNMLRHKKQIHIAWDDTSDKTLTKIKFMTQYVKPYKIMCYILVGFNTTKEQDLYRIKTIDKLGITPFVMPFKKDKYEKDIATFVNKRWIYKACDGDFNKYNRSNIIIKDTQNQLRLF